MPKADEAHSTNDTGAGDHGADTASAIRPFLFEGECLVRVIDRAGAPWFVAPDVCRSIGIQQASRAVEPLDFDEKGVSSIHTPGGLQEVLIVSEGGLYTLILRSRDATKPGTVAHRFRRWVTSEVIPAIRQTGRFEKRQPDAELPDDEPQTPDGLKLRKVNTAAKCFGERAGAQLWVKLGLEWVPAMAQAMAQTDMHDLFSGAPPGSVVVTVTPAGRPQ